MKLMKQIVDDTIDRTAAHFNLRDAIEDMRVRAMEAGDAATRNQWIEKGEQVLKSTDGSHPPIKAVLSFVIVPSLPGRHACGPRGSVHVWVVHQAPSWYVRILSRWDTLISDVVFKTLEKELREGGLQGLTPIERMEVADGMAVRLGLLSTYVKIGV
jgi:hypothetical protein